MQNSVKAVKYEKKGRKARAFPVESEGDFILTQEPNNGYMFAQIKKFLQDSKGARLVNVKNFFPDV